MQIPKLIPAMLEQFVLSKEYFGGCLSLHKTFLATCEGRKGRLLRISSLKIWLIRLTGLRGLFLLVILYRGSKKIIGVKDWPSKQE